MSISDLIYGQYSNVSLSSTHLPPLFTNNASSLPPTVTLLLANNKEVATIDNKLNAPSANQVERDEAKHFGKSNSWDEDLINYGTTISIDEVFNEYFDTNFIVNSTETDENHNWNVSEVDDITRMFSDRPKWHGILDKVITYIMMVNIINIMFGMGCAIYIKQIINNLWPPFGILIGLIGQFVVIPLLGFGMAIMFRLKSYIALGCLIVTCSPGGTFSNFYTFWLEGDLALSILMTSCSSIVAFVGMPLNLWMYSSYYVGDASDDIVIPYMNILKTLGIIGVPVIIGIIVRHFNERVATFIVKFTSKFAFVLFLAVTAIWVLLYWKVFQVATVYLYACAALVPISAMSIAYFIAFVFRRPTKVCRTIAIETGSQNMTVAMSIILLSFDSPELRGQLLLFPTLYGIFMMTEMLTAIIILKSVKRHLRNKKGNSANGISGSNPETGTRTEKEFMLTEAK